MRLRLSVTVLLVSTLAFAGITDDVRDRLARHDLAGAEAELQGYRTHQGVSADYLEALSWMARANLSAQQLDQAETYAKQTESLSRPLLLKRPLDAEPHLPIAVGAALEVQAQVLAARGRQTEAVALLRHSLVTYRNTSIQPRLQKNLNLLSLSGQPAPALRVVQYLGPKAASTFPTGRLSGAALFLGSLVRRL